MSWTNRDETVNDSVIHNFLDKKPIHNRMETIHTLPLLFHNENKKLESNKLIARQIIEVVFELRCTWSYVKCLVGIDHWLMTLLEWRIFRARVRVENHWVTIVYSVLWWFAYFGLVYGLLHFKVSMCVLNIIWVNLIEIKIQVHL